MGRRRTTNLDLPLRVYQDRNSYRYRVPGSRRSITLCATREEVETTLARITGHSTKMDVRHLSVIRATARKNAVSRGLEFHLTPADISDLWRRSGGCCELSGLKFDLLNLRGHRRRPFAPSIDRIDSTLGYTVQNCRLVVVILNLAINEFGEDVFAQVARAFLKKRASISRSGLFLASHNDVEDVVSA